MFHHALSRLRHFYDMFVTHYNQQYSVVQNLKQTSIPYNSQHLGFRKLELLLLLLEFCPEAQKKILFMKQPPNNQVETLVLLVPDISTFNLPLCTKKENKKLMA